VTLSTSQSEITRLLLGSALVADDVARTLVLRFETRQFATRKARAVFDAIRSFVSDGLSPGELVGQLLCSRRVVEAGVTCGDLAELIHESAPIAARAYLARRTDGER